MACSYGVEVDMAFLISWCGTCLAVRMEREAFPPDLQPAKERGQVMTLRLTHFMAVAVCASVAAQAAMAGAVLTRDNREVDAVLDLTDGGGSVLHNPASVSPGMGESMYIELDTGDQLGPTGGAVGRVAASQYSGFNASPEFTSLTASGYSWSSGSSIDFVFGSAQAAAASELEMRFTLDSPLDFVLTGSLTEEMHSSSFLQLRRLGGVSVFGALADGPFEKSGTLMGGTYELFAHARTAGFAQFGAAFDRVAGFDFELTLAPEPAMALPALFGFAWVMRRR
jgi:hypothetical protein